MQWSQSLALVMGSYSDYLTLHCTPEGYIQFPSIRTAAGATAEMPSPFKLDEMAIEMHAFSKSRKPTLLLMMHMQVFLDQNTILGSRARRGLDELRVHASRMQESLNARQKVEGARKSEAWTAEDERVLENFRVEANFFTDRQDPVTTVRKSHATKVVSAAEVRQYRSTLMERNPTMCGLLLFRLELKYQQLGLRLANAYSSLMSGAHLVVACRHSGNVFGGWDPTWPDMDKVLEIHHADDVFGAKLPADVVESQSAYLRMMGASAAELAAARDRATGSTRQGNSKKRRQPAPVIPSRKERKTLHDHTTMHSIFQRRFVGDSSGSCIDIQHMEALFADIKAREEAEEEKRQRKGAPAGESKGKGRAKVQLLRKERSSTSARYTVPVLMALIEAGLREETDSIRFDYVSMHLRCLTALKAVKDASPAYLWRKHGAKHSQSICELPSIVGYVLADAVAAKRQGQLDKTVKDGEVAFSPLLVNSTKALAAFFAKNLDEASIELSKLRLDTVKGDYRIDWSEGAEASSFVSSFGF